MLCVSSMDALKLGTPAWTLIGICYHVGFTNCASLVVRVASNMFLVSHTKNQPLTDVG